MDESNFKYIHDKIEKTDYIFFNQDNLETYEVSNGKIKMKNDPLGLYKLIFQPFGEDIDLPKPF